VDIVNNGRRQGELLGASVVRVRVLAAVMFIAAPAAFVAGGIISLGRWRGRTVGLLLFRV
jgi:hypothetical protein